MTKKITNTEVEAVCKKLLKKRLNNDDRFHMKHMIEIASALASFRNGSVEITEWYPDHSV